MGAPVLKKRLTTWKTKLTQHIFCQQTNFGEPTQQKRRFHELFWLNKYNSSYVSFPALSLFHRYSLLTLPFILTPHGHLSHGCGNSVPIISIIVSGSSWSAIIHHGSLCRQSNHSHRHLGPTRSRHPWPSSPGTGHSHKNSPCRHDHSHIKSQDECLWGEGWKKDSKVHSRP